MLGGYSEGGPTSGRGSVLGGYSEGGPTRGTGGSVLRGYSEGGQTRGNTRQHAVWVQRGRTNPGEQEAACCVGTARDDQSGGSVLGDRQCGGNMYTNTSFFFSFSFCLFFCVFFFFFTLPWSIGYHHNH